MKIIHPLSQSVISKIAAGEVVEKPLFAIKELVENAIDAKADNIVVDLEQSGIKKIKVIDNGFGMSKEDLLESFKPHTTSKITDENDLISVKTLGFRGEALSSIAAISNMIMQSKTDTDIAGTKIQLNCGTLTSCSSIGMPSGTSVEVINLFLNTPTRRKFIQDDKKEFRQIVELITHFALIYPKIYFKLIHNRKSILDLPKAENILDRVGLLLGDKIKNNLIPISFDDNYMQITGFIGTPTIANRNTNRQYLFLNGRLITDKLIPQAVKESFGNILELSLHPAFILFLHLPIETVDVNVHPRKEEVRFINHKIIFELTRIAIKQVLEKNNITFINLNFQNGNFNPSLTKSYAGKLLKQDKLLNELISLGKRVDLSKVIQIHQLYLVMETESGLLFIDQHAAHERILYEHILEKFIKQKKNTSVFELNNPITIQISKTQSQLITDYLEQFEHIGFIINQLNPTTVIISKVPDILKEIDLQKFFHQVLSDLEQSGDFLDLDQQSDLMIKYLACRAAVKAGDKLSDAQMNSLMNQFQKTPNNSTCPHGRPTTFEIYLSQLHKNFKR